MSLLASIGLGGGSMSFSGAKGSIPNDGDYVVVGSEKFIFDDDPTKSALGPFVYAGVDPTQSMSNLVSAVNAANKSFYQRPTNQTFWSKTDPAFSRDAHFDGRNYFPSTDRAFATLSSSLSGSSVLTVQPLPKGF